MKKSEFSEKFFEILVDHLLLNHGFQIFIPSQNKENKLGYDALINNIKSIMGTKKRINGFALQYKIVEKYKKPQNKKGSYFRNYLIQRAENGTQTRDPQLGRLVLYRLSYFRKIFPSHTGWTRYARRSEGRGINKP